LTHCSCCLGRPAARRASRWAIRTHAFAAAALRQTCTAGASTTLGDDCNADATERGMLRGSRRNGTPTTDADGPDAHANTATQTQRYARGRCRTRRHDADTRLRSTAQ
jgi:hypothetical protein